MRRDSLTFSILRSTLVTGGLWRTSDGSADILACSMGAVHPQKGRSMKTTIHSFRIAGTLLAIVAVLACGSSAWAQAVALGTFVLPVDVQWNGATLPAGQYHFTLHSGQFGGVLLIRDGRQKDKMLAVTMGIGRTPDHSALTIVRRQDKWHVASLALETICETLEYSVPAPTKAERKMDASIQVIPVRIARS